MTECDRLCRISYGCPRHDPESPSALVDLLFEERALSDRLAKALQRRLHGLMATDDEMSLFVAYREARRD